MIDQRVISDVIYIIKFLMEEITLNCVYGSLIKYPSNIKWEHVVKLIMNYLNLTWAKHGWFSAKRAIKCIIIGLCTQRVQLTITTHWLALLHTQWRLHMHIHIDVPQFLPFSTCGPRKSPSSLSDSWCPDGQILIYVDTRRHAKPTFLTIANRLSRSLR